MTGYDFAVMILMRYPFTTRAIHLLLARCQFFLLDPTSNWGGGHVIFGSAMEPTEVHFYTVQEEAAVHELAHAWWCEIDHVPGMEKDRRVAALIAGFLAVAKDGQGAFGDLCRLYRDGDPNDPNFLHGMWLDHPDLQRWNHDEILAGFASWCMGDIRKLDPRVRPSFTDLFHDKWVYLPVVNKAVAA